MAIITLLEEICNEEDVLHEKERSKVSKPKRRLHKLPFRAWRPSSPSSVATTLIQNPQPRMGDAVDKAASVASSKKAGNAAVMIEELKGEVSIRTVSICTLLEEVYMLDMASAADANLRQKRGNFSARRFMTRLLPRAVSDRSIRSPSPPPRSSSTQPAGATKEVLVLPSGGSRQVAGQPRSSAVTVDVEDRNSKRPAPPQTSFHEL